MLRPENGRTLKIEMTAEEAPKESGQESAVGPVAAIGHVRPTPAHLNKTQHDALLPHVEDGTITLVGATTVNPRFDEV